MINPRSTVIAPSGSGVRHTQWSGEPAGHPVERDSGTSHPSKLLHLRLALLLQHACLAGGAINMRQIHFSHGTLGNSKGTKWCQIHWRRVLRDYALKYFRLLKALLHVVALGSISKESGLWKPPLIKAASSKFIVYQCLYLLASYVVLHPESLPPSSCPYRT